MKKPTYGERLTEDGLTHRCHAEIKGCKQCPRPAFQWVTDACLCPRHAHRILRELKPVDIVLMRP